MVTIRNKLPQPVTVNIGNKKSIHFLANETKNVTFEEFQSKEMREKTENGTLVILRMYNQ